MDRICPPYESPTALTERHKANKATIFFQCPGRFFSKRLDYTVQAVGGLRQRPCPTAHTNNNGDNA